MNLVVSDIVKLDKKRSKVYIDGEFAFVLYDSELRKFGIEIEHEIGNVSYQEIVGTLLVKRVRLRAMNLLQKKDYTEKQLRDKLSEGLYPPELVDDAIDYVKSYRYLDDERFARDYITYHISSRSKNRIIQDLSAKGIDKSLCLDILDEVSGEEDEDIEIAQIQKLLIKKHYDPNEIDIKAQQKIIAFLLRRGYKLSDIKRAMRTS
ncbi:regulatory protein RecX [Butyrivibrio sp. YAB3001]|uniref:regulatory protein RecX n=1 Tax=Butyrivibrio sp. YAB3001 TaxID=1520812 RepID=UPI000B80496F|nr:regulatory protein RecX [Butyrivibrio sp. YAB3001]